MAQDALEIAEALELDELRAHALTTIGSSKFHIELSTGRPDLEQALEIALAADSPIAAVTLNNLAVLAIWEGDFPRACEIYPEARGSQSASATGTRARFMRGNASIGPTPSDAGTRQSKRPIASSSSARRRRTIRRGSSRDARALIRLGSRGRHGRRGGPRIPSRSGAAHQGSPEAVAGRWPRRLCIA